MFLYCLERPLINTIRCCDVLRFTLSRWSQDENLNRKRLSALLIVALLAAAPLTISIPQTDADVSPSRFADLPRYGYVLTMADGQVDSVVTYENSYSDTPVVKSGLGDWSFINGLGPFNSFYAAINLVDDPNDELEACGESRISRIAGKVAYILNPDDLSKTLGGNSYTGSYNIMFVIPTVYWFADGNVLYLSNDPAFFGSPTTVDGEQRMGAYAHTVTNVANGTATVYDCLCLGVYEASSIALGGKQTLISQSGAVPFTQNNLANLRSKAINNNAYSDGIYGLWNYYHWTLFKMMSYTVMCDKNSKAMVGNGVINSSSLNNTGGTDADGWYSGTTSDETTSSKLFLENVWGNIAEYLDNVYMDGEGKLYAGDGLGSGVDIAIDYSSTKLAGKDHINGKQTLVDTFERIKNNYSSSYDPIAWDSPEITSDAVNPSGDSVCIKHGRTIPTCLSVGGSRLWTDRFNNIGSSGLSSISATLSSGESTIKLGSRLAYLMNMDAIGIHRVVYESTEGGTVSGPDRFAEAETVSLTVDCDIDFRLSCLTYSYYADTGVQTVDITNAKEFVMPSASVTVRAEFERVVMITVDGSPVNGRITVDPDSLSFNVSAGASFSAQRNTLTIFDSDGSTHTLTATADRNHHFYGFMDSDYRFITNGCFFISTVITAKFVTWVPVYQVEFYETDHRITTLYVDSGDMVMMPEPIAQEGKDFAGWYSDSSFTQYVGPQCTYYGPNGDNERIRLYARFIDIVGPVNSDYQVSCQFVLDGGNAT